MEEILTYKDMLLRFAAVRGLKRYILSVPVMTPKISSYWLYFVTSTSYKLAVNLVNNMKVEVIARENRLHERLGIQLLTYDEAVRLAFDSIDREGVVSSWTDAYSGGPIRKGIAQVMEVPVFGCYKDQRKVKVRDERETLNRIWSIGGRIGWYYAHSLWEIRGFLDKLAGGVGLRRGRKNPHDLEAGDSLDFWRVIDVNRTEKRLLLYAEMKLPGDAWLEFKVTDGELVQTATFRPLGLLGRIYWYTVMPFHGLIFNGMAKKLAK